MTATAGIAPAVLFLVVVAVVTVVAMFRAPRGDVLKIFAAFTTAFGFRRIGRSSADVPVTSTSDTPGEQGDGE